MHPIITSNKPLSTREWVRETRFGRWFLATEIWRKYVLAQAVADCKRVVGNRLAPGAVMIDAGCGVGLSMPLIEEFFQPDEIIGIDIDRGTLEIAAQNPYPFKANIKLLHASAQYLDLPSNSVDAIFCHQLIHHVGEQKAVLDELLRILKPGGFLLSSESCQSFIKLWWVKLFFRHPDMVQKSADKYVALIRASGYEVAEKDIYTYTPWWSLVDFGLRREWGLGGRTPEVTELITIAQKPMQEKAVSVAR